MLTDAQTLCACDHVRSMHFHHKDFGFTVCQANECVCRKFDPRAEEEETETRQIPLQSMAFLVFGAPRPRRVRLPFRLIFVAAFLSTAVGCATSRPAAVEVETVGNLSASYHSVAVAPLKHDAPPELGQVIDTDDDAPATVKEGLTVHAGDVGGAELPDVAAKTDGVTTGAVR